MSCTPKPNGFADHYPYEKWLFHWEYTQHFQTNPCTRRAHPSVFAALLSLHLWSLQRPRQSPWHPGPSRFDAARSCDRRACPLTFSKKPRNHGDTEWEWEDHQRKKWEFLYDLMIWVCLNTGEYGWDTSLKKLLLSYAFFSSQGWTKKIPSNSSDLMWSNVIYIYIYAIKIQQLCRVAPEECFKNAYRESIRLWAVFSVLSDISPFMLPCWHVSKIHQAWHKLSIVSVNWSQINHG